MPNNARRQWMEERTAILENSANPEELGLAATELAYSDDPDSLEVLATFLRRSEFLDRLDPPEDPAGTTVHLRGVVVPLIERPGPEVVKLCLSLAENPAFLEHDRKSSILEALAAFAPMSEETVGIFRRANEEGYFGFNALLLAANSSPLALQLFASMMAGRNVDVEDRVEYLHKGIVPYRNRLSILQMAASLMTKDLEEPVATAVIESVFDYRVEWFKTHGPMPPGWRTASDEVLRFVINLGARAARLPDLPASLEEAIGSTIEIASALLERRAA